MQRQAPTKHSAYFPEDSPSRLHQVYISSSLFDKFRDLAPERFFVCSAQSVFVSTSSWISCHDTLHSLSPSTPIRVCAYLEPDIQQASEPILTRYTPLLDMFYIACFEFSWLQACTPASGLRRYISRVHLGNCTACPWPRAAPSTSCEAPLVGL